MNAPMYSDPARKQRDHRTYRRAAGFTLTVIALAAACFGTAVFWIGQCSSSMDTHAPACGRSSDTLIAVGSPLILLVGGVIAFVQTYLVWRRRESWWIWQGAGWILLLLMVMNLALAQRAISPGA